MHTWLATIALLGLLPRAVPPRPQGDWALDPTTYVSPSGEYELFVDPSQREGAGPAHYRFTRHALELWSGDRPWTLQQAVVSDDGVVGGYAYAAGSAGGLSDDALTILVLEADGRIRHEERVPRTGFVSCMGGPEPSVRGIFLEPQRGRLLLKMNARTDPDTYWAYSLAAGASAPKETVHQLEDASRVRVLPGKRTGRAEATSSTRPLENATVLALAPRGSIELGANASTPSPIRDIAGFALDGLGWPGFLRSAPRERAYEFVLVDPQGGVELELPLPPPPEGEWRRAHLAWLPSRGWLVAAETEASESAWLLDDAAREWRTTTLRLEPKRGAPIEAEPGTFLAADEHALYAFDATGRLLWSPPVGERHTSSWLPNPVAVARTTDGRVAALDRLRKALLFFSSEGAFEVDVDLTRAWGREPEYLSGLLADVDGGLVVHDYHGAPPVVRMDGDGRVRAEFAPRFADGRTFDINGLAVAPDGTLWTSDGRALYALDERGVVARTLGGAPDPGELGRIVALALGPGDLLHAVDERTGAVHVFDALGRRVRVLEPAPTDFAGALMLPSLTVSDAGEVFLAADEPDDPRFVHFDADGRRLGVVELPLDRVKQDWYAQRGSDRRWVVGYQRLFLVARDGSLLREITRAADGTWLRALQHAAVAPDGSIAVLEERGRLRAQLFSPAGDPLGAFDVPGVLSWESFAFDGQRLVFAAHGAGDSTAVVVLDRTGRALGRFVPPRVGERCEPFLAAGGDELWLFDGARRVDRFAFPR